MTRFTKPILALLAIAGATAPAVAQDRWDYGGDRPATATIAWSVRA